MIERQHVRRSAIKSLAAVTVLCIAYAALPLRGGWWWVGALVGVGLLAAIVPLTVRRVMAVSQAEHPVLAAAEALAMLFTMLVTGFAAVYFAVARHSGQFDGIDTRLDAVYFTVTTLSTVGFGDITAIGQTGRAIVTLQMIFDLAFIGVAVRVLVAAARRR